MDTDLILAVNDILSEKHAEREAKNMGRTYKKVTTPPPKPDAKVKNPKVKTEPSDLLPSDTGAVQHTETHHALKNFFEIMDEPGHEENIRLERVWEYLQEKYPNQSLNEYKYQLRRLEDKIGVPRIGETRLGKLHQYIQAQKHVEEALRWRKSIARKT